MLVGSALLVLAQLYLAIPLAPVIGEVFGSGGSAAAAPVGTNYALAYGGGVSDLRAAVRPLRPQADLGGRRGCVRSRHGRVGYCRITACRGPAANPARPSGGEFGPVALAYVGEALPPRWRSTGIGAMSTAFLSAGILGQVYAQAVAEILGWRWVFGLAAPACMIAALVMAMILIEPARTGEL